MVKREEIEARTAELVMPLITMHQFELVDVEFVKEGSNRYLRLYIDKEGGITVNDCEAISRPFSDLLDVEDYIEESYILEVSSPGLGRPLKKDKDFKRHLGDEVEIRLFRPVDRRKEWEGILTAYDDHTVTIETEEGEEKVFERTSLALIRLALDF